MRATRRRMLQLSLVGAVAGCTPDPTVRGTPGSPLEPVVPTRAAEVAAAAAWVEHFADLVESLAAAPASWGADEVHTTWVSELREQCAAHVSRVVTEDPVVGGPTAFPLPTPAAAPSTAATTPEEAMALLTASVADGMPALESAMVTADGSPGRLFYASLMAASTAGLTPALPPVGGGAEPSPFDDSDVEASVSVALTHVWALLRGLELGLGRLEGSDDLQLAGAERFDSARVLRNKLLSAVSAEVPDVQVWDLPDAMSTAAEIRAAWAVLEGNVLNALAGLSAVDTSPGHEWLQDTLAQVGWVHRWGGRVPHWPGWVAAA